MFLKYLILLFCLISCGCVFGERTFYDFYKAYPIQTKQGTFDFLVQGTWKSSTEYGSPYTVSLFYNTAVNSVAFIKDVKLVATGRNEKTIISERSDLKIVANEADGLRGGYSGGVLLGTFELEHIEHKLFITLNYPDSKTTELVEFTLKPYIHKASFSWREDAMDLF